MHAFWAVAQYEYRMAVRGRGLWLVSVLAALLYATYLLGIDGRMLEGDSWQVAAQSALALNLFMPLAGGIVVAGRLPRDRRLGVWELFQSMPLSRAAYVLGKYAGAVLAALTPLLSILSAGTLFLAIHGAPASLLGTSLLAFLAISVPAYAFVGAYSLACPAVLPVPLYWVLFTGYWFWANFLPAWILPTLSGTLLTPLGVYVADGFFHVGQAYSGSPHTAPEAVANLVVLFSFATAALVALERYLAWQAARA